MRIGLSAALLSLVLSTAVNAATITYSSAYGPLAVPTTPTIAASLPQFNPALGTLFSVTLQLDATTFAGQITWDNESALVTDVTLGVGADVTATGLAGLAVTAVPLQIGSMQDVAADNDGAADFLGSDSFSVVGGTGSDSDADTLLVGLAPYIGVGSFDVTVDSVVSTFLSTSGGFGPIDVTPGQTSGTVSVIYNYTAVPEASTFVMLGTVAVIGAVARFARRRAS